MSSLWLVFMISNTITPKLLTVCDHMPLTEAIFLNNPPLQDDTNEEQRTWRCCFYIPLHDSYILHKATIEIQRDQSKITISYLYIT